MPCPRCHQRTYSYGAGYCKQCAAIVKEERINELTDAKDCLLAVPHIVMPPRIMATIFDLIEKELKHETR